MRALRPGFTLLELLVGLTVASMALAVGVAALGIVRDRAVHAEEATVRAVAGATQRNMIVDWLAGARMRAPTGEQFEGMQQDQGGVMVDVLLFPTTAHTPLDGSHTVVGLYIDNDPETPEQGLVAEMTGMLLGAEPRRMELVPEAGGMRIRYLSVANGIADWADTWAGQRTLPRMIEITLEPAPRQELPLMLQYPIRVAFGSAQ
jgi:prepilin-type N-terminal cleavage/methylation domain-containing protein